MQYVGIRELKNRLTHYLQLTRNGANIIVTDRGKPMAILHALDKVEEKAGVEERLAALASKGLIRLPVSNSGFSRNPPASIKGKPVSQMIIEDRR